MKRYFIYKGLPLSFLFVGLLFSCNKHDFINKEDGDLLGSTRSWISNNSGIIKSNSLVIENGSGLSTVTLDFASGRVIHSSKNNFVEYSFVTKTGGDFQSNSVEDKPVFKVVIQVNKVTKEKVGRLVSINSVSDSSQNFRRTKQFYYLDGKKANSYGVKKDNSQIRIYESNNDNLITNNNIDSKKQNYVQCTPFSGTTYSISCTSDNTTGSGYDVVCVFKKKINNWDLCIKYGSDDSDDKLFDYSEYGDDGDLNNNINLEETRRKEFDDKITDSLSPCLDSILTNIKALKSGKIAEIIQKFSGEIPNWDWVIVESPTDMAETGKTEPIITSLGIKTYLNPYKLKDATILSTVRTILHESVHAYLTNFFRLDHAKANLTFPEMQQAWNEAKNPSYNKIQHDQMVKTYIEDIAALLKEYSITYNLNITDDQIFKDLAWGGLDYVNNSTLDDDDKERISKRLEAELKNRTVDGKTPSSSKTCK